MKMKGMLLNVVHFQAHNNHPTQLTMLCLTALMLRKAQANRNEG